MKWLKLIGWRFVLFIVLCIPACDDNTNENTTKYDWPNLEAAAAADNDLYASGLAGIAVRKPPKWRFVANEEISRVRSDVDLEDQELESLIKDVILPVVSIMKHPDTYDGVNPTVQIGVRARKYFPTTNPYELLSLFIATMKQDKPYPDWSVVEDVRAIQVDGVTAATFTQSFTLQLKSNPDLRLKIISRMYYAINSKNVIIVGLSGPASETDSFDNEFSKIMRSLQLEP